MAAKVARISGIEKNIFIEDDFISSPKSFISTAMFNVKGRTEKLEIVKENYMGYNFFKLFGTPLNLGIDFQFFFSILLKYHETNNNVVTLSTNDVYTRMDTDNTQAQNNNGVFIQRLRESALRIMDLKMEVSNDYNSFLLSTLFPTISVKADKTIQVVVNPMILEIFKVDCNAIYNINFNIYNKLKMEYSKALYLFYLTNNANLINTFSVEDLRDRLMCHDVEDKKFNFNVTKANNELRSEEIGFLKYAEKVTTRKKKVTHYEVSTKVESIEEAEKVKKELKAKKEVVTTKEKPLKEVKEVVVEVKKEKKPDLKMSLAQQEMDRLVMESKLFNESIKELQNEKN